jgi:hypothetical protein
MGAAQSEGAEQATGWAEQLDVLTHTRLDPVAFGGVLGMVAAALLQWVVWPYVLGWPAHGGSGGKRRGWTATQFITASAILGAWFAGALGTLGIGLFVWGLAMWAFNRSARLGNTGWDRP